MIELKDSLYKDLEAIRQIPMVPTMLEVVCQITGMGFAAVARVTQDRWLACSVRDEVEFGLEAGGELPIASTLCNEIRDHRQPIVIDNVANDPQYSSHHTPATYGLQSYISVPIILKNGDFFGTLCAIDSKPARVNNSKVINTFLLFADLLSFHLQSLELLEQSFTTNIELHLENTALTQVNTELDNFIYTASHDLKSPIANIEGLVNALSETVAQEKVDKAELQQMVGLMKTSLRRFGATIKDLTAVVEADQGASQESGNEIHILDVVEKVMQDLNPIIEETNASIEVQGEESVWVNLSRKNFKSILHNLLSNALKYRSPERTPQVLVKMYQQEGKIHLSVADNGLGIPEDKQDKVFAMFKRFHSHVEGSGLGLYIVKRMVDNMNGQILVDSTPGQGTTFTVVL